jgi:hypothetical protein
MEYGNRATNKMTAGDLFHEVLEQEMLLQRSLEYAN